MVTILDSWRLIDTGPLDGPANMAVDEALLECFEAATSIPILRLYGWEPPALSLGRFQEAPLVLDLDRCAEANLPVVRRITGGGVIFHADELTYSIVCAPSHLPEFSSIKDSFRILTAFLLRFYRELGLVGSYALDHHPPGMSFGERTPFCFSGRESCDILINGRKIGGNAQRRQKKVIFQHGSIPLNGRSATGITYLRNKPAEELSTASIAESGVTLGVAELRRLMAEAFEKSMGVTLRPERLTEREEATAARLVQEKYAVDSWNIRGVS